MDNGTTMKSSTIRDRLVRVVGDDADFDDTDGNRVTAAPTTESACAAILKTAHSEGWKVRFSGSGAGPSPDIPADLVLTTRRMHTITETKPADLFATAEAGVTTEELKRRFTQCGMWLAMDPPGENRTIGSIAATGASGSLQTGYGPVRDQILGLTVITPEGRVIVCGGRVVKNVAGYDMPKLMVGGFGAFGLITKVHLRLRVAPETDVTWMASATFDDVLNAKRLIENSAVTTAALELRCAQADEWTIAVRLVGSADAVERHGKTLAQTISISWSQLHDDKANVHWAEGRRACVLDPVTIRLGASFATVAWTANELKKTLVAGFTTIYGTRNVIRWSGTANADAIRRLRSSAADQSVPLTIENAPWKLLSSEGHFGELRSGVAQLVSSLRSAFDPTGTLVIPLTAHSA